MSNNNGPLLKRLASMCFAGFSYKSRSSSIELTFIVFTIWYKTSPKIDVFWKLGLIINPFLGNTNHSLLRTFQISKWFLRKFGTKPTPCFLQVSRPIIKCILANIMTIQSLLWPLWSKCEQGFKVWWNYRNSFQMSGLILP